MKSICRKIVSVLCCSALCATALLGGGLPAAASAPEKTVNLDVEGSAGTVLSEKAAFTAGETVYEILTKALDSAKIAYDMPDSSMGRYIKTIGQDAAAGDYSTWWSFYLNDQLASTGISSVAPVDGDRITVAFCGASTLYPLAELSPRRPLAGQKISVKVTASVFDYVTNKTSVQNVSGAAVELNGVKSATGSDGTAALAAPSAAGSYFIHLSCEVPGGSPKLVRRDIPVTVYASLPAGDDGNGYSLDTENTIDVCTAQDITARLNSAPTNGKNSATLSADKSITVRNGGSDFSLSLSAGTTISGANWNSGFLLPQQFDKSTFSLANATVQQAVHAGADTALSLSKPARLYLPGAQGCSVGYYDEGGNFRRITAKLVSDAAPADDSEAVYDDGAGLAVYTATLGKFVVYRDLSSGATSDSALKNAADSAVMRLGGDTSKWAAFALARSGHTPGQAAVQDLIKTIAQNHGNFSNPAALSSACLVFASCGVSPKNVCGVNLYQKLYQYDNVDKIGLEGPTYALLALDAQKTAVPESAKLTRQRLISKILGYQHDDGSFSISTQLAGDTDTTALAITALAPYVSEPDAGAAVNRALSWLSAHQQSDGGFESTLGSSSVETSESTSTVIIALSALKIDVKTDVRFVKNKATMLDSLMSYKLSDGGFAHVLSGKEDTIATEQALMALTAYRRLTGGSSSLYDLTDMGSGKTIPETIPVSGGSKAPENPETGSSSPVTAVSVCLLSAAALLMLFTKTRRK